MAQKTPQSYANHRRFDPAYHYFLFGVVVILALLSLWNLSQAPRWSTTWDMILAIAAFVLFFKVRTYPLRAQDRIIRLEERLRLQIILPESLRGRIVELTERQLIGLRFASDGELATLAEKALDEKLSEDEIKRRVVNWRADTFRV